MILAVHSGDVKRFRTFFADMLHEALGVKRK